VENKEESLRFEISATQYALRVYYSHADNYVASATIRTYGDVGWMSQITGIKFYEALREHFHEILAAAHCRTLEGYMTDAHARLLKRMCRGRAAFGITHRGQCAGREMPWVIISPLEPIELDGGIPTSAVSD
jgi:hypothetical protein